MNIERQAEMAADALTEQEAAYERAFERSRAIVRKTKTAIHGIHIGHRDAELIDSISGDLAEMMQAASEYPSVLFGPNVETAMGEFAETVIYDYSLRGEDPPPFPDLDITPSAWACGLADAIGELRRDMLTALMEGRLTDAAGIFSSMERLSDALMRFDVKECIVPLRRKQDIARSIMDRSRQDLATAKVLSRAE